MSYWSDYSTDLILMSTPPNVSANRKDPVASCADTSVEQEIDKILGGPSPTVAPYTSTNVCLVQVIFLYI